MARPRQVTDDEILEAARVCFIEHGPSCSTSIIATRLGVSQAALFKRFGTKHELMCLALLPPAVPDWIAQVERGVDGRPIPEQLHDIARSVAAFFDEFAPRLSTLKASGVDMRELFSRYEVPPPLRGVMALQRWLAEAADLGRLHSSEPHAAALVFLGAFQGRAFLSHVLGLSLADDDRFIAEVVATIWHGLAPKEDS